jgi:hypothetical protein
MNRIDKGVVCRYIEFVGYKLFTPLRFILELMMGYFNVMFFYRVDGSSYGDTLAISAVIAEFARRGGVKAIVYSKFPALFIGNSNVVFNIDYNVLPKLIRSILKKIAKYSRGKRVICVDQERWVLRSDPGKEFKVDRGRGRYLTNLIPDLLNSGFLLSDDIVPEIYFSDHEVEQYQKKYSGLPVKFSTIKASVGKSRIPSMLLKEWGSDKMDAVANHPLLKSIQWLQIGERGEFLVSGAIDMTGIPIRESLFLVSRSQFVLSTEGFISHAAAGVNTPAVVVFSGRAEPEIFIYPSTVPVTANKVPDCSPCMADYCHLPEKVCTEQITVEQVVDTIVKSFEL